MGRLRVVNSLTDGSSWMKKVIPLIIGLVIFVVLPILAPSYLQSMLTQVVIFAIFALSLNLIWGYGGLMSMGHAAYFAVGGYLSAIFILKLGIDSFWIILLCGLVASAILAAIFGIVALRVSGIYFLLVTLALGQLIYYLAFAMKPFTGGTSGIYGITHPDLGLNFFHWNQIIFYFFVLIFAAICFYIIYRIVNSPFGQALQGIRESKRRMRSLGYNTWLFSYIAFVLAGIFAGLAGVLFSYYEGGMGISQAGLDTSTVVLLIVILGSTRVFWGPVLGSVVVLLLEYFVSIYMPARWPLILGAIFVISVLFLRGGIGLYLDRIWQKVSMPRLPVKPDS